MACRGKNKRLQGVYSAVPFRDVPANRIALRPLSHRTISIAAFVRIYRSNRSCGGFRTFFSRASTLDQASQDGFIQFIPLFVEVLNGRHSFNASYI